jgi:hypothetical protein
MPGHGGAARTVYQSGPNRTRRELPQLRSPPPLPPSPLIPICNQRAEEGEESEGEGEEGEGEESEGEGEESEGEESEGEGEEEEEEEEGEESG